MTDPQAQSQPIVKIALPLADLNFILNTLAEKPYGQVAGLISAIQAQAQSQLRPPQDQQSSGSAAEGTSA